MSARRAASAALLAAGIALFAQGGWIHAKAALAQVLLERAWNASLGGREGVRPWPWADTVPVGRLRVPAHDVDWIVLAGASGRTLAFAPGHLSGSAPLGGAGHAIVAGHRDTHFAFLRDLALGERIEALDAGGVEHVYRVVERAVVDERDATAIDPFGPPRLSLVTCWPFDTPLPGGSQRLVVVAELDDGVS